MSTPTKFHRQILAPAFLLGALVLAFTAAPALAASPETPITREAKSITGSSAALNGELNPNATTTDFESEEYEFAYAPSSSECTGGLLTPAAIAMGEPKENVPPIDVTGLEGSTEYSFCAIAIHTPLGEPPEPSAPAAPLTFTTLPAPPEVAPPTSTPVSPFEEKLEATVNPENQPTTSCVFEYGETIGYGKIVKCSPAVLEGGSNIPATASAGGLKAATKYHYRVVVKNATGSTTASEGTGEFTTPAVEAPKVENVHASEETPFAATLDAEVNPDYQSTSCEIEYGKVVTEHKAKCAPATLEGSGNQAVSLPVTGLEPSTTYHIRVVAENTAHEKGEGTGEFKTLPKEAPTVEEAKASGVTPFEATLEAQVNPKYQQSTCEIEYGIVVSEHKEKCAPPTLEGSGNQGVSLPVKGLAPNTTYHIRVVAENTAHEKAEGTGEFKTLPKEAPKVENVHAAAVTPPGATLITPFEATLEAEVNPEYQKTSCEIEYGKVVSEHKAKCVPATLEGSGNQGISLPVKGLEPATTYHIRVTAENIAHEKEQSTGEFTTEAFKAPIIEAETTSAVTAVAAQLHAQINPDYQATTVAFEYASEESVLLKGKGTTVPGPSIAALGGGQPVSVELGNVLRPDTKYYFRAIATNGTGTSESTGNINNFKTLPAAAPTVEPGSESVTEVSATSATLHATINPGGLATTYTFEYAPTGGTFAPVSEPGATGTLPEGTSAVPVEVHVQHGLTPATGYEFRVVVSNSVQAGVEGEPVAFTTQTTNTNFTLPDNRAYEMVSPPQKNGARIAQGLPGIIEAAASGEKISYISKVPTESEPAGFDNNSQDLSTRGPSGWTTRDLSAPHELSTAAAVGPGPEYRFFSSDLSHAIVQPYGLFTPCENAQGAAQPCLSPEASEQTAFLQETGSGVFTPFVTGCPETGTSCPVAVAEHADVAAGTVFGGEQEGSGNKECKAGNYCGPFFVAGTPDLSHVLLESDIGLTTGPGADGGLYEASKGELTFVGKGENEAEFESASNQGAFAAHGAHGISMDGSRVVFRGKSEGPNKEPLEGLLMRETTRGETVRLGEGEFQDASADDSRVFFDAGWEGELDVFELTSTPGEPLAGHVTDLTEGNGMRGLVLGASEDGSYVYFVSEGALAGSGATTPGAENLYVDHYNGTTWMPTFISTLASEDSHDWDEQKVWDEALLQDQPARVSPDGRWLAFMSQASLTDYDNRDARTGVPDAEVYLYHAETGEGTSLTCASCAPTGARPAGVEYKNISSGSDEAEAGTAGAWLRNASVAANLPGSRFVRERPLAINYQPRFLSDGGRVFFDSEGGLVPLDVNGTEDVYEYEPEGVPAGGDACGPGSGSGSVVLKPARAFEVEGHRGEEGAGCVGLISSGSSGEESAFLDASEGGGDVFFLTSARLSPEDQDTALDVYDAHECTSVSPCVAPVTSAASCEGEASCRPSQTLPPAIYGVGPTEVFSGPGDVVAPAVSSSTGKSAAEIRVARLDKALKVCRRDKRKRKRQACEKAARKRYGAKVSAKKSARVVKAARTGGALTAGRAAGERGAGS